MKSRLLSVLLVLTLVFTLIPLTYAQDGGECFNLSAEDCAILTAAQENTAAATSFNVSNFRVDVNVGGIAALAAMSGDTSGSMSDISFSVVGSGPMAFDPAALESGDIFSAANIDLSMELTSAGLGDEDLNEAISFLLTGGIIYLEQNGMTIGIPVDTAMQAANLGGLGLPTGELSPEDLMSGTMDPSALLGGLDLSSMPDFSAIPNFATYERLADEDMMGMAATPYSLTFNLTALLQSTEFQTAMSDVMSSAASQDPSLAQMGMIIPLLARGITAELNVTHFVATDAFVHRLTVDLNGQLDLGMLMPASGSDAPQMDPITLDVHFEIDFDQFNESFDFTPPADATIVTPEMMGQGS